jgi:hypothetical protein
VCASRAHRILLVDVDVAHGLVGDCASAPASVAQAMGSLIKKRRKRMRKKKHKKMLKKTRWQRRAAGK